MQVQDSLVLGKVHADFFYSQCTNIFLLLIIIIIIIHFFFFTVTGRATAS